MPTCRQCRDERRRRSSPAPPITPAAAAAAPKSAPTSHPVLHSHQLDAHQRPERRLQRALRPGRVDPLRQLHALEPTKVRSSWFPARRCGAPPLSRDTPSLNFLPLAVRVPFPLVCLRSAYSKVDGSNAAIIIDSDYCWNVRDRTAMNCPGISTGYVGWRYFDNAGTVRRGAPSMGSGGRRGQAVEPGDEAPVPVCCSRRCRRRATTRRTILGPPRTWRRGNRWPSSDVRSRRIAAPLLPRAERKKQRLHLPWAARLTGAPRIVPVACRRQRRLRALFDRPEHLLLPRVQVRVPGVRLRALHGAHHHLRHAVVPAPVPPAVTPAAASVSASPQPAHGRFVHAPGASRLRSDAGSQPPPARRLSRRNLSKPSRLIPPALACCCPAVLDARFGPERRLQRPLRPDDRHRLRQLHAVDPPKVRTATAALLSLRRAPASMPSRS